MKVHMYMMHDDWSITDMSLALVRLNPDEKLTHMRRAPAVSSVILSPCRLCSCLCCQLFILVNQYDSLIGHVAYWIHYRILQYAFSSI